MKKTLLLIFALCLTANSFAGDLNKTQFDNLYNSLESMSGNKIMRKEIFERDYGLLYQVAGDIKSFYGTDMSEANTTFKDHIYYLSYLFLSKENEMKQDLHVGTLKPLLTNMYKSIIKIIHNYNWEVQVGDKIYRGEQVLNLPQFNGPAKQIRYKGSSLIKIFTSPLIKIIPKLTKETVLGSKVVSGLKAINVNVTKIQGSKNPSDLSRKINRAAKKMIDEFDAVEEDLKIVSRQLKRSGNINALQLVNKTRIIINSIKELKDYGKNYTY